jgi:hypothetical protein
MRSTSCLKQRKHFNHNEEVTNGEQRHHRQRRHFRATHHDNITLSDEVCNVRYKMYTEHHNNNKGNLT